MKTPAFLAPLLGSAPETCALVDQRGRTIATSVHGAFDSKTRKKGLLGRDHFAAGHAIVIAPCNAVHTFFMRFPIDVVYLNRDGRILRVKTGLRSWRIDACLRGFAVVELPAGTLARLDVRSGDVLTIATKGPSSAV